MSGLSTASAISSANVFNTSSSENDFAKVSNLCNQIFFSEQSTTVEPHVDAIMFIEATQRILAILKVNLNEQVVKVSFILRVK